MNTTESCSGLPPHAPRHAWEPAPTSDPLRIVVTTDGFPLACRPPSTTSAARPLQTRRCSAVSSVLRSSPTSRRHDSTAYARRLSDRSASEDAEDPETSRFPREMCPRMHGVCDCVGSMLTSPKRQATVWPTAKSPKPRHPEPPAPRGAGHVFRSSIPGLPFPLSTLRPHPRECARMTRGRRSWLSLQRMTLSFTTSRRF